MKKGILIGLFSMASLWGIVSCNTDPEVIVKDKIEKVYLTDVQTQTVTKEVKKPQSKECKWFIEAAEELNDAYAAASTAQGSMKSAVDQFDSSLGTEDVRVAADVQSRFRRARAEMESSWLAIGTAQASFEKYEGACD